MPSIPPDKVLSDPTKPVRHYAILLPFLEGRDIVHGYGFDEILDECDETLRAYQGQKPLAEQEDYPADPGTSPAVNPAANPLAHVGIYAEYHKLVVPKISCLRERHLIFYNPVTPDLSEEMPQYLGIDHASDRNRFSGECIRAVMELEKRRPGISDRFAFVPVGPFVMPFRITRYRAAPVFIKEIREANRAARHAGNKWRMGLPIRRVMPRKEGSSGLYKFSPAMYDSKIAKTYFPDEDPENIVRFCRFHRTLLENVMRRVADEAGVGDNIYLVSKRGSYPYHVMENVAKMSGRKLNDFSMIMRNRKRVEGRSMGEADVSALYIMKNALEVLDEHRTGLRTVPA